MSTAAQIAANQANAQKSTGPTTDAGKAKSSLNAVKTGLTGRTVLLPSEDAAAYQAHLDRAFAQLAPVTDEERGLAQAIADTDWRLLRIPSLELGIYAIGRRELAELFTDETDESTRASLIDAKIFLTYQRQLNNLSVQEGRLRRQREADTTELKHLQTERQKREAAEFSDALELYKDAIEHNETFDPAEFGFEISIELLDQRLATHQFQRDGYSRSVAVRLAKKAA